MFNTCNIQVALKFECSGSQLISYNYNTFHCIIDMILIIIIFIILLLYFKYTKNFFIFDIKKVEP